MTGLIAAGIGAAGAIGSSLLPGLMTGKGGTTSAQQGTQNSNSISGPVPGSPYEVFQNEQLAHINDLSQRPYQPYDTSKMFAGFNPDQYGAFQGVRDAASSWQNSFGQAGNALTNTGGAAYDPVKAAQPAFGQASSAPGGVQTANPYAQTAAQMTPDVIQGYMNPYINGVVNNANRLQTDNYLKNTLPGLTNQFVSSGGGLGSSQYGKGVDWSLGNFNRALGDTTQTSLAQGWNSATGAAQTDLARQAGLAGTMGNLALGDISARTNLGTAMGNNAAQGAQTGMNRATAFEGLGTGWLNNALTGANAQLQIGNQQQQQAQLPLTAAYQQFKEQQNDPYAKTGWAASTANQYQWPMRQNTSGSSMSNGTSSSSSSGSPLSTGLGIAATVGSILPKSGLLGTSNDAGSNPTDAGTWNNGQGVKVKTGGYIRNRFNAGGYLGLNAASCPPKAAPAFKDTYADGGAVEGSAADSSNINRQIYNNVLPHAADWHWSKNFYRDKLNKMIGQPQYADGGFVGEGGWHPEMRDRCQPAFASGGDVSRKYPWPHMPRQNVPGNPWFSAGAMAEGGWVPEMSDRCQPAFASGGYLGIDRTSMPVKGTPTYIAGEPMQDGFDNIDHASCPPKAAPAFANTYATGGSVAVIKAAKKSTDRSLKASRNEKRLKERMARPDLPLDLSGRTGHFQ
jgi:hypothetical protein